MPTRMSVYDGPTLVWWIGLERCFFLSGHFTGHFRLDLCPEIGGDCTKTNHRRRWAFLVLSMATNAPPALYRMEALF